MGHLTRDLEIRTTQSGLAIGNTTIAVTEKRKDNEHTSFIDVKVFGKMAENFQKFVKKGQSVHINGRLRQESWEDKQTGQKRSKLGVLVDGFQLLPQSKKRQEVQVGGDDRGTQFQNTPDDDCDVPF